MSHVWINGALAPADTAALPLADSGLLHGQGVFTTLRAGGGRIFYLAQHLQRVRESCQAFSIPLPYKDDALAQAATDLLQQNTLTDARLRLTVTRGIVQQHPLHGPHAQPNVFITAAPLDPYPAEWSEQGITVILVDDQKLNPFDIQAGHKTLNYLSRSSALREARRRGASEGLWFDINNQLQSGCIANVLIVKDGALVTPPTTIELRDKQIPRPAGPPRSCVLPGITRAAILDLAAQDGIEPRLQDIDIDMLLEADEVILSNSIMRLMPVSRIERHQVGSGRPGPVTQRLTELLAASINQQT